MPNKPPALDYDLSALVLTERDLAELLVEPAGQPAQVTGTLPAFFSLSTVIRKSRGFRGFPQRIPRAGVAFCGVL